MSNILKKIFIISALFFLSNCTTPLFLIGGGAAVGTTVAQERSVGNTVDDLATWTRIKNAFLIDKDNQHLFPKIKVKVIEGRVLLTGTLTDPDDRVSALRIVWSQRGVNEVINEINIDSSSDNFDIKNYTKDTWITTQAKSKILLTKNVKSINYSIDTVNQIVYVMGIAEDQEELSEVTRILGTIKGVSKVVSYVRMKDSNLRKEMLKNHY